MISVLVIAHNEEKFIERCLKSLQKQDQKPDEIVLIAHNCTDTTVDIAGRFKNVRVVEFTTKEVGAIYARIKGFEEAQGDIVACIDGDSYASPRWLEKITKPLITDKTVSGIGGLIWFNGLFANLASFAFFFLDPIFRPTYHFYFWGANFALRRSDYEKIGGFTPFFELKKTLHLQLMPEDAYLACALMKLGKVQFVPSAVVYSDNDFFTPESFVRKKGDMQNNDRLTLFRYFHLIK